MAALDDDTRHRLLRHVRALIVSHLTGTPPPEFSSDPASAARLPQFGVFVTLRNGPRLRGCIGTFDASEALLPTLQRIALSSLNDPRFRQNPVVSEELPHLRIEVSLVSPMEPIADPLTLTLGRHGIYVRQGSRTGCFLPEVATDSGWNAEEFLSYCCAHKAGLPPDAWRRPDTEVHIFTVEKIAESH